MLPQFVTCKSDQFIAGNPCLIISIGGAYNNILHVVFCSGDKKSSLHTDEIEHYGLTKQFSEAAVIYSTDI